MKALEVWENVVGYHEEDETGEAHLTVLGLGFRISGLGSRV